MTTSFRRLLLPLMLLPCAAAWCQEAGTWVLGATAFEQSQKSGRSESRTAAASLIPKLILEQVSSGAVRVPKESEGVNRKLYELRTKRIALFLELGKAVRSRDALVVQDLSAGKLKKKIAEAEEKIQEIQDSIDENLKEAEKVLAGEEEEDSGGFFGFFRKKEKDTSDLEPRKIVLYKGEPSELFSSTETEAYRFEKAVVSAGISGLVSGTVTQYGDYLGVSAELKLYPGAEPAGSAMEVGRLNQIDSIARNLCRNLMPFIANAEPVTLRFSLLPVGAAASASLTIDGVVYSMLPDKSVLDAGTHIVTFSSPGYVPATLSYDFSGSPEFVITARLSPVPQGSLVLHARRPVFGKAFVNGEEAGAFSAESQSARIMVNGITVLGYFEGDDGLGDFFYIPESKAIAGANLEAEIRPEDLASNIDTRRRRLYLAYTALTLSLPPLFYCYGNYVRHIRAYNDGIEDESQYVAWQKRTYVTYGITGALGAVCLWQLARYLWTADRALPERAKDSSLTGAENLSGLKAQKSASEKKPDAKKANSGDEKKSPQDSAVKEEPPSGGQASESEQPAFTRKSRRISRDSE